MVNSFLKKLQIKATFKVKVENAPENAAHIFGEIPADVQFTYAHTDEIDALITFTNSKQELHEQIKRNLPLISSKTVFWVFYPKKSSRISTDLALMKSWEELSDFGLTPCASAAVNETWTALRLKLISAVKPSGMRNDHIKTNLFGDFIDPDSKTVKLPSDLQEALIPHPTALDYFSKLSYTNRKEYILWILSAKQEKTRQNRVEKTVDLLMAGKKNPSSK
jgi:hypothetical protein